MSDYEKGINRLLKSLEDALYRNSGVVSTDAPDIKGIKYAATVRGVLRRELLPLLEAEQELLGVMETCHICKGLLLLEKSAVHCNDCSADCENHDGAECPSISQLHEEAKTELTKWTK